MSHEEDINSLTDCITDYINSCVENTVPSERVLFFPNNKPWVTPDLKALLNRKKRPFFSEDKEELRTIQWELRYTIGRCKKDYKERQVVTTRYEDWANQLNHDWSDGRPPVWCRFLR